MGEHVETYYEDGVWRSRIVGRHPLPGTFANQETACEIARAEARLRGVGHVIRRADGSVAEHNRYPRRSSEIPG